MTRKLITVLAVAALFKPLTTLALAERAAPPAPTNQCELMTIECWQTYDDYGASSPRAVHNELASN